MIHKSPLLRPKMEEHIRRVHENTRVQLNRAKETMPRPTQNTRESLVLNWTFTLNNPVEGRDDIHFKNWLTENATRAFFELEHADQGTPHYQGYFILKCRKTLSNLKRHLSNEAHFEPMKKNEVTNFKYCSKEMYANKTNFYVAIGDFDKVDEKKTANHSQEALKTLLCKYQEID